MVRGSERRLLLFDRTAVGFRFRVAGRRGCLYLGGAQPLRDKGSASAGAPAVRRVALDARLSLLTLFAALLFLWPLLAYGRPGYIQDSAAYYKGGRVAVAFVVDKIEHRDPATQTSQARPARTTAPGAN